ncbi:major capsid protein [Rhizobium sp. S95]|uniref:Major capsid protein n=1 Tax=Ciceribacter sichuanensis TaxID=2949647 RepID=A0AAJ1BWP4_9HYPH|nr:MULTISPECIES: major capsid protein [unclassified Ciceribacter]MCM2396194.1 major capsid protein [Ciceribacter sp. S95]MCO5957655.1 major capsid protein [Ciceribacter sp. S101]
MAIVADIFNQNAWGLIEVQEEIIERVDFKPQLLGSLGLFAPIYSRSRTIGIVDRNGSRSLIPTSANGEPPEELIPKGAKLRKMDAVRLAKGSTIYEIELAGIAALPFDEQTIETADEVTSRTGDIKDDLELTWEHMRFGAIMGKVLDADGATILVDWYDFWGIDEPDEINFKLDIETTDLRKICRDIKRQMKRNAKGAWTPATRVGALVGDTFYDMVVNHPQYKETKVNTDRAPLLENIEGYSSVEFEGITFINYQGTDDGTTIAIGSEEARFFPIGAKGAFQVGWAPASEFKPYRNKRGQEFYGLILTDPSGRDEWDRVELYSYPLFICTRPEMLLRAKAK